MKLQIAKWGNSAAIRLPKAVLELLDVQPGSELEVTIEGRTLKLAPAHRFPTLAELVAEMKRLGGPEYDYGQREWSASGEDWPEDPSGSK